MNGLKLFCLSILLFLISACSGGGSTESSAQPVAPTTVQFWEIKNIGGDGTSQDVFATSHAFGYPMKNLSEADLEQHLTGDPHFERQFSDDPARPDFGLGPVQNNTSCIGCHNRDGRGSLPVGLNATEWKKLGVNEAIFLRISIENDEILNSVKDAKNNYGEPTAVPGFSHQLFHTGTRSLRPDFPGDGLAEVYVKLEKSSFTYPDGRTVELSKPIFEVRNPYDQWLDQVTGEKKSRLFEKDVRFSPRIGPPMIGLGLLEHIPAADLIANAQFDRSGEGVYGKINKVFDAVKYKNGDIYPVSIGRFGLKGSTPTVEQQSLGALQGDIGMTNYLFPQESIHGTPLMDKFLETFTMPMKIEASEDLAKSLVFYSSTLAVPPRRNVENLDVIEGGKLFAKVSCTSCHTPSFRTGAAPIQALANQEIYPFTDLLLHDMGEGLADNRQDFEANGREWKTRALWGIGLTKVINPRAGFLHDGRANTIEEAILWHDGEAKFSKNKFVNLSQADRTKLIQFINSL